MTRASGALLHISSLPGPFGIGCFGDEALHFAQLLHTAGCRYWQVLPFTQTGNCDSPYQSFSAFAGNELFIDPRQLHAMQLLSDDDLAGTKYYGAEFAVDFDWVRINRQNMLQRAFENISEDIESCILKFRKDNFWLDDVALFLTIREMQNDKPWWEWDEKEFRQHDPRALDAVRIRMHDRYFYYCFVQYIFFSQWLELKQKINDIGISIIGDIPIYVSADSADVWSNAVLFQVNPDHSFSRVSGVPPDYFSKDGQLWGNPLYRWEAHAKDGYDWWIKRLAVNFLLFDKVRIDHFRGFYEYWSIAAAEDTAKNGIWVSGPGMDFFRRLAEIYPDAPIIAEDLGEVDDAVRFFLTETGFPGMRVLQFGFQPYENSTHLPHNYPAHSVAYTGTHDNNTIFGWIWDATPEERAFALAYCGYDRDDWDGGGPESLVCRAMIRLIWQSHADLVIVPIQDLLGFGKDTRMNIPGIATGNWTFRVTEPALSSIDTSWLRNLNRLFSRQTDG